MSDAPVLEVQGLTKIYRTGRRDGDHVAVSDVSFVLSRGGSIGIVGESGAGKSTIAKILMGLEAPTEGRVLIHGEPVDPRPSRAERKRRGRVIQMVFQDPFSSLDPRQTIGSAVDEILRFHFEMSPADRRARVTELLDAADLSERHANALPHELSGGQCQRAAIVRALAARPEILVLDEHVSALDVSIQAQVLNLLESLRRETAIAYVIIAHDLAVVHHSTEDVVVLREGEVVEGGPTSTVLAAPHHAYTRELMAAVPRPGWRPERRRPAALVGAA